MVVSKFKPTVSASCAVAIQLLKAVDSAADGFGALKAVTGPALFIAESVQDYQSHRKDWLRFSEYVQETLVTLLQRIHDAQSYDKGALLRDMEKLRDALNEIQKKIEKYQRKRCKWWYFVTKPQFIEQLRKDFMEAIAAFKMEISMTSALNVAEIQRLLEEDNLKPFLEKLDLHLTRVMTAINLVNLPVAGKKSTYNYDNCCLEGTRICVLKDILDWLSDGDAVNKPRIRFLTDVAGSGKSAVAHSVARLCKEKGILASSFFFDREIAGQNDTTKLFTSIAHDLAKLDERLASEISNALAKQSARNCLRDEFQYFILDPLTRCPIPGPRAIVIDALDEGYDVSLLRLLKEDINKLPPNFRIFITSRPEPTVMRHLESLPHLDISDLDIDGDENRADISRYSRFRLHGLSELRRIPDWPVEQQRRDFELKAEGLMLFVSTLVDFLEYTPNPERQLKLLLLDHTPKNHTSTSRMDQLYAGITSHCFWDDPTFVADYQAVVGIVVAAKKPLTMASLQALLDTSVGNEICAQSILCETPLRTLLLGCTNRSQPVKTLHLSFREFLTNRTFSQTFVDEKHHSQRLALLCLQLLNLKLTAEFEGLGYLKDASHNTPLSQLPDSIVSQDVDYACRFWLAHVYEVVDFTHAPTLVSALRDFLSHNIIAWLEIVILDGKYQRVFDDRFLRILEILSPGSWRSILHPDLSHTLYNLAKRLVYLQRYDEAFDVSQDNIFLHTHEAGLPNQFDASVALSLVCHLNVLIVAGQASQAVVLAEESLQWFEQVTVDDPAYIRTRSRLLHNFASALHATGRVPEAVDSVKKAIALQEQLPITGDYDTLKDLPQFTMNLAKYLQRMGLRSDAIPMAERAVALYRNLVASHAAFQVSLANALATLSECYAITYQYPAALSAAEEAVDIHTSLASSGASFDLDLALSLVRYANLLDRNGKRTEGSRGREQAINLLRRHSLGRVRSIQRHLADNLFELAKFLRDENRRGETCIVLEELVELLKSFLASPETPLHADQDNTQMIKTLRLYCQQLRASKQPEKAIEVIQEAASLARSLQDSDSKFAWSLVDCLDDLSSCLLDLHRNQEVLAILRELVTVFEKMMVRDPSIKNKHRGALEYLAYLLRQLGHSAELDNVNRQLLSNGYN